MQRRKESSKKSCPHKQQKLSLDSKILPQRKISSTYKSPEKKLNQLNERQLLLENQQLKEQNQFYQEYFATFEKKYKDQKRENRKLQKQIQELHKELSRERDSYILNKRCQTAFTLSTSQKAIPNKLSRATKCSRGTFNYE